MQGAEGENGESREGKEEEEEEKKEEEEPDGDRVRGGGGSGGKLAVCTVGPCFPRQLPRQRGRRLETPQTPLCHP